MYLYQNLFGISFFLYLYFYLGPDPAAITNAEADATLPALSDGTRAEESWHA